MRRYRLLTVHSCLLSPDADSQAASEGENYHYPRTVSNRVGVLLQKLGS